LQSREPAKQPLLENLRFPYERRLINSHLGNQILTVIIWSTGNMDASRSDFSSYSEWPERDSGGGLQTINWCM